MSMTVLKGQRKGRQRRTGAARRENPSTDVPRDRLLMRVLTVGLTSPGIRSPFARRRQPTGDFDGFYRSHYPSVTRLAYSLCGSMAVAEELAQEAFVTAHRRWPRVAAFDRPDLWVRRVVINRSISHRRSLASERGAIERLREFPATATEVELADEELWEAMRSLSGRQAEVLALVYVEDQPIAEVAAILGLGEETVRTHLKRGRAALSARLEVRRTEVGR